MTDIQTIERIVELLERKNIRIDPGLSEPEIDAVESMFRFRFPPDLRCLLQTVLPTSDRFYDWRRSLSDRSTADEILRIIDWPRDGILFDVENKHDIPDTIKRIPFWSDCCMGVFDEEKS